MEAGEQAQAWQDARHWVVDAFDDADVAALLAHFGAEGGDDPRARLDELLAERAEAGEPKVLPLSWNQTSLWYLHQLAPTSPAYHVGGYCRLGGGVDVSALEAAVQAVSDRHPALRTRFFSAAGRPFQQVHERLETPLRVVDCSDLGESELIELVQREYETPLDLERGPAFNVSLYTRPDEDPVLLVSIYHAFIDLWSLALVYYDMGLLYQADLSGEPAGMPPPDSSYADFVRWQREFLRSEAAEEQARYWERELAGLPPVLDLPVDRPRPPLPTQRGWATRFALEEELTKAIVKFARKERTTTFVVLLAAFQTLMARYSGQDDFGVGAPLSGRGAEARFRDLVGHCVNMGVIRANLADDPSFTEHLGRTRRAVGDASKNEDYPFSLLIGRLGIEQEPSRTPLFQTSFIFQQSPLLDFNSLAFNLQPKRPIQAGGLTLEPFPMFAQQGQFDLSVWTAKIGNRVHGELKYSIDLFEQATAERICRHYETLLRGIVADPDKALSQLRLVDAAEHALVVDEWNQTERPYRQEVCMHQLFEEQVERTPAAVAVTSADRSLTYAELEQRANQLAHELRSHGVGRDSLVAVFMNRSPDTVVAVMGILKAGAGYVPLEPHYPAARIRFIITSLGIRVAVSETARLEQLQAVEAETLEQIVCLDEPDELAGRPTTRVDGGPTPESTAYIIFTSGSTGTPKGVEVKHRSVINLIEWVNRTYEVGPEDKLLFITSPSFDLSVYDMFGSLAVGATIRIAAREEIQDPHRLTTILCEEGITIWDSAPPALNQLVPFLPESAPQSPLRLVLLSGDWIPVKLPDQIRRAFPAAHVVSLGGATEATIWSNWYDIGDVDPNWVSIPYGKPIQNARYYVLDSARNPCPVGVPGDLFIGGECLAAGYVNDPEKTADKFVPDPFSAVPGARMYDTGDRARFFGDGNIEFLGRRDFQVKIRGYRIELGEIEAVLGEHPRIQDCTVIARADAGTERYLAAYLVPRGGGAPATGDLRAFLKERLPDFMVPQHFVTLDGLPLTPNGKVDWRALPVPERSRDELMTDYVAPETELERELAEIWQGVLGIDRVGAADNFFELGGHSLLAVQVVHQIETGKGVTLPVSALLQTPTVRDLARRVEAGADGAASVLVPLRAGDRRPPLVLFHPSGGEVIAYRALLDDLDPEREIVAVQSLSRIGAPDPDTVDGMADAYADSLAETVAECDGLLLAGWSLGGVLAQGVAARLEATGKEVALCALLDSVLPAGRPELLERIAYRLGAALGPLAGSLAGRDPDELAALLELPTGELVERAIAIARRQGDPVASLARDALEREIAIAARHSDALARHEPSVIEAPIRLVWAELSTFDGEPATNWSAYTRGDFDQTVLPGAHHYTVLAPAHVEAVCTQLNRWIAAVASA